MSDASEPRAATIERYGIEPVPAHLRTVRWQDLFCILINFQLNPGQILVAGMSVAAGLPVWAAILAQTGGTLLAFLAYVVMATIGVDHGVPGQVAARMAFGIRGAKLLPSVLRTVASVYWFAFQTVAGSLAIVAVLDRWTGTAHSLLVISLVFGFLQALVAVVGYGSLKILSRIALPLKLVILGWVLWSFVVYPDPHFRPAAVFGYAGHGFQWLLFVTWLNTATSTWLTMITDAADFCRYSRSRRDMWIGTLAASGVGAAVVGTIGAYAAGATEGHLDNAFALMAQISPTPLSFCLLLLVIVFDNWTINVLNLYTGGLSLLNVFERIGRFGATVAVSILGIALSSFPSLAQGYTGWLILLGTAFSPVAGILLADYLLLKRLRPDVPALLQPHGRYWYAGGVNPAAMLWTAIGVALSLWIVPASMPVPVIVLLLSGGGYFVTMRLWARRSGAMAAAIAPVAAGTSVRVA
ncbi:purine-cytosine permease family protein [Rhizosaccharibacter radicis]|uniref:Cytosine permease n=1 Tax=Rhizosaccharibacter radicis TaxID=2782605 RepID=A0ABT1VYL8_9PROT|nr:cytosine permease [Acetobacteraceae bacterium KSS12]